MICAHTLPTEANRELPQITCFFAYPRHNEAPDIIHQVQVSPFQAKSGLTLRCHGRRCASSGSYDGDHPEQPQTTKVLLPSGLYSANVSVPHDCCYAPTWPILSWRFVPPGPITTHPSVVRVKNAQSPGCPNNCHPTPDILPVVTNPASPTRTEAPTRSAMFANFKA